jgi:signal transduction histidine kinase/CheY-like chemotaxis protein
MDRLRTLIPREYTQSEWAKGSIVFFSCFLSAILGAQLFTAPAVVVPVSGVALAAIFIAGFEFWPFVYAGFLGSLLIAKAPPASLLLLPAVQTVQPLLAAYVLKRFNFDPLLRRLQDMFLFLSVAIIFSALVPTAEAIVLHLSYAMGNEPAASITWDSWWVGHLTSLLVISPLIIRWIAEPQFYLLPQYRSKAKAAEIALVLVTLVGINWLISWQGLTNLGGLSMIYVLLVPLFWLAIRVGPRFTILGMFLVSVITLAGAIYGPFASPAETLGRDIFQTEIFICIIAVVFYIIAGLQEERTEVTKSLQSYIGRLEDALSKLSVQDRAKNDFIAILAHELRNPLAPVVSALELLRINYPDKAGEEREALDLMDDRLKTIERLLDDLLDVSRISRAKLRIKKEPADLRIAIEHSIQAIDRHIKNRTQTLVLDVPSEPVIINADPVRIEQVITNLLNNASKFTSPGGRIEISAKRHGSEAVIRIIDNGIGIDADMLERIFEPFLQLETGEPKGEGLGIGLSLTQRLVEMHEGSVEARSAGVGEGSEFIVRLPVLAGYASTPIEARPRNAGSQALKKTLERVLVVDDNTAAAHGIGKLLEHKGYTVSYAYSGAEAKEKIASEQPEAVILDIGLPDTDGYSLARMARMGLRFDGLLIALTGYGQEDDKEKARQAGFDYHLTKPVGIEELHALLTGSR